MTSPRERPRIRNFLVCVFLAQVKWIAPISALRGQLHYMKETVTLNVTAQQPQSAPPVSQGGGVTITIHDHHSLSGFKEPAMMTYSLPCASDFITAPVTSELVPPQPKSPESPAPPPSPPPLAPPPPPLRLSGMFTGCEQPHPTPITLQPNAVEVNLQCLSSSAAAVSNSNTQSGKKVKVGQSCGPTVIFIEENPPPG